MFVDMSIRAPLRERLIDHLSNFSTSDMVNLYNEYAYQISEDTIFSMSEFDEKFRGMSPLEIVKMVNESEDFDIEDDYYWIDYTNSLISFSDWTDYNSPIEVSDLANYIIDNDMCLSDFDFQFLLDTEED